MSKLWIRRDDHHVGSTEVTLDGVDIVHALRSITVEMGPSTKPTTATAVLNVREVAMEYDEVKFDVVFPGATREFLISQGWTPPGE